ncbi:MAG: hypothetical protein JSW58_03950 [Candidatus Latescibacterota bacterium]|nr:MAG: hypothetical protein JSW58_03950 [Candidatus Latescibacterota bacterium]
MRGLRNGSITILSAVVFTMLFSAGCSPAHFDVRRYTADDGSLTTRFRSYDPAFIEGVDAVTRDFQVTGAHHVERSEESRICNIAVEKRIPEDYRIRYYLIIIYVGEKSTEFESLSLEVEDRHIYLPRDKKIMKEPKLLSDKTVEQEIYYRVSAGDLRVLANAHTVAFELEVKVRDEPVKAYLTNRTIKGIKQFVDEHVEEDA